MKISKAEIEAIIEASCRTFVPLHQLVLSLDHQARPAGSTSAMSIEELAASIQECGVLQNLIVVKGERNRYEVPAVVRRARRLRSATQRVRRSVDDSSRERARRMRDSSRIFSSDPSGTGIKPACG